MAWPIATCILLLAQAPTGEAPAAAPAPAPVAAPAPGPAISPAPAATPAAPVGAAPAAPGGVPAAGRPAAPVAATDSILPQIIMFAPLLILFYLMAIRPQQQQERKRKQMVEALKRNDKVLTSAGIYGTVVSVDAANDKVILRVDEEKQVKFTFSKASIVRVIDPSSEKAAQPAS